MIKQKQQVVLIILDGWGHSESSQNNAIAQAKTPYFDYLWKNYPHSLLEASGRHVGLPENQVGNSEIGHMTIGSGQTIYTDLEKIGKAIKNGDYEINPVFLKLFNHVKKHNSTLHIKGLIGPGGVHAHSEHLYHFLKTAKKYQIEKIAIHAFTDGRDTPPQSASQYLRELEDVIEEVGVGFIATASGRFYAMDRDNNWDRLEKTEKVIFEGTGSKTYQNIRPSNVIKNLHQEGILDEHLEPVIFLDTNGNNYIVQENDAIFMFNFRSDRAKMISQKFIARTANKNILYATMTNYSRDSSALVAYPKDEIKITLASQISQAGLTQTHIAETEKYAHVTYFFNGGKEEKYPNEKHILINSRKDVTTHDQVPEMKIVEITDEIIDSITSNTDFTVANFANSDMVGHTANVKAIIQSIEKVDEQLKRVVNTAIANNATVIITADHGNAELNIDNQTGERHTAHTLNKVPLIITKEDISVKNGKLSDVAPTVLGILDITPNSTMTGENLIKTSDLV